MLRTLRQPFALRGGLHLQMGAGDEIVRQGRTSICTAKSTRCSPTWRVAFDAGPVRITGTPVRYKARSVAPAYREKRVDSELSCSDCTALFQVFGVFGFCPGCRSENQAVYDANLAILRRELAAANDQGRVLRHAYSDLVSSFEHFCAGRASEELRKTQFQDLFKARGAFKEQRGVDILTGLSADEILTLRRVFHKRHAHIHNRGLIGDRYRSKGARRRQAPWPACTTLARRV